MTSKGKGWEAWHIPASDPKGHSHLWEQDDGWVYIPIVPSIPMQTLSSSVPLWVFYVFMYLCQDHGKQSKFFLCLRASAPVPGPPTAASREKMGKILASALWFLTAVRSARVQGKAGLCLLLAIGTQNSHPVLKSTAKRATDGHIDVWHWTRQLQYPSCHRVLRLGQASHVGLCLGIYQLLQSLVPPWANIFRGFWILVIRLPA